MVRGNVLVIEPHADDAFLSLGAHIEAWRKEGAQISIATVYSGTRKRAVDASAYAAAVGAEWYGFGAKEGDTKAGGVADGLRCLRALLPEVVKKLGPATRVIGPLGIVHPEHIAIAGELARLAGKAGRYAYVDQPYALVTKNTPEIMAAWAGTRNVSRRPTQIRKYRHIPLFKDQAKFFYYNPPTALVRITEEIVEVLP